MFSLILLMVCLMSPTGTTDVIYLGMLRRDRQLVQRVTKLSSFDNIVKPKGVLQRFGDYTQELSGLYFVSITAILNLKTASELRLLLNVGSEPLDESILQSYHSEGKGTCSLQVHGIVQYHKGDVLSVLITSNVTGNTLKTSSSIAFTYLTSVESSQAFLLRLKKTEPLRKDLSQIQWTSTNTYGSFVSSNLFTFSDGYFVTSKTALYYITGNFLLQNRYNEKCTHNIRLFIEKLPQSLTMATKTTSKEHSIFTMNFSRIVRLMKGVRIWLKVQSTCFYIDILQQSTYSLIYLQPKPYFSIESKIVSSYYYKEGWNLIDLRNFKPPSVSGVASSRIIIGSQYVQVPEKGLLLITGSFFIKTPLNATNLKIAVTLNTVPIVIENTDIFGDSYIKVTSSGPSIYRSMISFSTILPVKKDDHVRFSIYFPFKDRWMVFKNSSISLAYIKNRKNFSMPLKSILNGKQMQWQLIDSCIGSSDGLYSSNNGIFKVMNSGIYILSVRVTIYKFTPRKLLISIIYDKDNNLKMKNILTVAESSIDTLFTFHLRSSLRIDSDQRFGVYMQSEENAGFEIKCSMQLAYLGYRGSISGFYANLNRDNEVLPTRSVDMSNFFDPSQSKLSQKFYYNSGNNFPFKNGTFTAPKGGIYLVTGNVILRNVNLLADDAFICLMVTINNDIRNAFASKRSKATRSWMKQSKTTSFNLNLPLKLQTNDRVNLKINSNLKSSFKIDKQSSFSIVFITDLRQAFGFLALPKPLSINVGDSWVDFKGWTIKKLIPSQFDGLSKQNPELVRNEKIIIHKSAHYIFTIQIHIKLKPEQGNFQLGLFKLIKNKPELITICDEFKSTFTVTPSSCAITIFCEEKEEFLFRLKTETLFSDSEFAQSNDNGFQINYLSILMIPPSKFFPAGSYQLAKNLEFTGSPIAIIPWHPNNQISSIDAICFSSEDGKIIPQTTGWYLISVRAIFNKPFGNSVVFLTSDEKQNRIDLTGSITTSNSMEQDIRIAGLVYLKDQTETKIMISGSGPTGQIIHAKTDLSFSFIPSYFNSLNQVLLLVKQFTANSKTKEKITQWMNKKDSSELEDVYLHKSGIYIICANLITKSKSKSVSLETRTSTGFQFKGVYEMSENEARTFLLTSVIVVRTRTGVVSFYVKSSNMATILPKSSVSIVYLGDSFSSHPQCILRVFKKEHFWVVNEWFSVKSFVDQAKSNFYHKNNAIVPLLSGIYYLSLQITIVTDSSYANNPVVVGIFMNDELTLSTSQTIKEKNTLIISQSLYLRRGAKLIIKVMSTAEAKFYIDIGSIFHLVMIENLDFHENIFIPVITSVLLAGSYTKVRPDMDVTMNCNTVGEGNQKYRWFRNDQILEGHSTNVLRLSQAHRGRYQCQAMINNVGPVSRTALVVVEEINECLDREMHCNGSNQTCVDTVASYYCQCLYDLKYYNGHCYEKNTTFIVDETVASDSIPIVLLIIVPFLSITFLVIVTLSIYICIKKKRNSKEDDIETVAFSTYNERENAEEIALQDLSYLNTNINEGGTSSASDQQSIGTVFSYTPSNVNDFDEYEEDAGGFTEYKYNKLLNANTRV